MRIFETDYTQPKRFLPGTRRSRTPAETLADFGRHMPEVGITRLANVTGLDSIGIPVVQAIRPNTRSLSVSQGKGADVDAAKASAMMEAIELWHAERIELPCLYASYRDLRKARTVVDAQRLPLVKGARFRPEEQRCWLRGWDLLQREEVWVPFEMVTMNTVGVIQSTLTFMTSSNGLASWNHVLEAIEHALCEVIERDTHALHVARGPARMRECRVAAETIDDPSLKALLEACFAAELDVAILELDSDIGVPTFRAGLVDREDAALWRRLGAQWGCGTHLSPTVALSRAITEAAQGRLTVIAGSRDDNPPTSYADSQDPRSVQSSRNAMLAAPAVRAFRAEARVQETGTFEGDLELLLGAIRAVGATRAIVVDLSKPQIGIPVVKVIVPELEAPPTLPGYTEGARARARPRRGTMTALHVFLGPSLSGKRGAPSFRTRRSCRRPRAGDVYLAVKRGAKIVAIIDGIFEQVPSIWHKEVLYALDRGVHVFGASSMGALRAAELHTFGMVGIGRVFEAYRSGAYEDDDEVAVVHGSAEDGFQALSEAMVNVRDGLAQARERGLIGPSTHDAVLRAMKSRRYPERTWGLVPEIAERASLPRTEVQALLAFVKEERPNRKRSDAIELLTELQRFEKDPPPPSSRSSSSSRPCSGTSSSPASGRGPARAPSFRSTICAATSASSRTRQTRSSRARSFSISSSRRLGASGSSPSRRRWHGSRRASGAPTA